LALDLLAIVKARTTAFTPYGLARFSLGAALTSGSFGVCTFGVCTFGVAAFVRVAFDFIAGAIATVGHRVVGRGETKKGDEAESNKIFHWSFLFLNETARPVGFHASPPYPIFFAIAVLGGFLMVAG
jgi:hypothetical protein